jgi:hopanoid biosynthesis associated protein HpnK
MKQLILNADDFGLTRGVNEGIIRAHHEGVLTSTTLMACGAAFEDAVERAKANPELGVGCHLMLVGGCATASRGEISSLADESGWLPKTLPGLIARLSMRRVPVAEIEREMRAQINKIREAGIEPTHLDTHKHTHAHPIVMEALGRAAQATGITRVRKPIEGMKDSWQTSRAGGAGTSKQMLAAAIVTAMAPRFAAIAKTYGLHSPDHFLGLASTGQLGPAMLRHMIESLAEGQTEIMVHPGISDADLQRSGTRLLWQRETELEGLLDTGVKGAIEERGIRLISYREVN